LNPAFKILSIRTGGLYALFMGVSLIEGLAVNMLLPAPARLRRDELR
jgi:hypothetical protein